MEYKISYIKGVDKGNGGQYKSGVVSDVGIGKLLSGDYCYSPSLWLNDRRKGKDVDNWVGHGGLIILDFDDGITLDQAMEKFKPWKYLIGVTRNHQKVKNGNPPCDKFRLVLFGDAYVETLEDWRVLMDYFIKYHGADPATIDGHRYYFGNPLISELDLYKGESDLMFNINRGIEVAWKLRKEEEEKMKQDAMRKQIILSSKVKDSSGFWDFANKGVSQKAMLIKLSGTPLVDGDVIDFKLRSSRDNSEHILCNGLACNAWLDGEGFIGSKSVGVTGEKGGPTWVNWCRWYGKEFPEIADWFKKESGVCPDRFK